MFYALHSQGQRAWQTLAVLIFLIMGPAAMAWVTTSGCSSQTSCTGEELDAGGEFTVNGVRFANFGGNGVYVEPSVRYTPYDDESDPGFLVTRDNSMPLYRAEGVDVDYGAHIGFYVESVYNRAILYRNLAIGIGEFDDSDGWAEIDVRHYYLEFDLEAFCGSSGCANETISNSLSVAPGTYLLDSTALSLTADIDTTVPGVIELVDVFFSVTAEPSDDVDMDILSGNDWLSNDTNPAGWQTVTFDDSAWVPARAPYPSDTTPVNLIPGTEAQFMWFDPDMMSDGGTGVIRSWYRYPFHIDLPGDTSPGSAIVTASVDDDYDLYVNGTLVFENHDNGFANIVHVIDIADHLQDGDNLIAIYAVDGGWVNPRPRGFERVLVDADITLPRFAHEIRSNESWRSSDTEYSGWQDADFPDGFWGNARSNYPNPTSPQALMQDSLAEFIWHDPDMTSDGTAGPIEAFFRYNFHLQDDPATYPVFARAKINADDDYDFYVNGVLVHRNNDDGFPDVVDEIEFTDALQQGRNSIAIRVADGSGDFPFERGYERLMFEGLVATGDGSFANDADGDEVNDFADNCIESYNPAQTDSNGDGYGNTCDPDLNNDGIINVSDLGLLRLVYFSNDEDADFNHDGDVNATDLGIMKQLFFQPPGPSAVAP